MSRQRSRTKFVIQSDTKPKMLNFDKTDNYKENAQAPIQRKSVDRKSKSRGSYENRANAHVP